MLDDDERVVQPRAARGPYVDVDQVGRGDDGGVEHGEPPPTRLPFRARRSAGVLGRQAVGAMTVPSGSRGGRRSCSRSRASPQPAGGASATRPRSTILGSRAGPGAAAPRVSPRCRCRAARQWRSAPGSTRSRTACRRAVTARARPGRSCPRHRDRRADTVALKAPRPARVLASLGVDTCSASLAPQGRKAHRVTGHDGSWVRSGRSGTSLVVPMLPRWRGCPCRS